MDLHDILNGAERIHRTARQTDPPLDVLGDLITLLYEALSDLESLIDNSQHQSGSSDNVHPVENLRALIQKIGHTLRQSLLP